MKPDALEHAAPREQLLATAMGSPEAVGRHDKAAWLSLFSCHAVVEDPVGAAPHVRRGASDDTALGRFYEAFIAPNRIVFHVARDIVVPGTVVRDVTIEVRTSSDVVTNVPTYILYEIVEEDGALKIARLAAHWELATMVAQVLRQGWPGISMSTLLGLRMLRCLGAGGVLGYSRGFSTIGHRGKEAVLRFGAALADRSNLDVLFESGTTLEFPATGERIAPAESSQAIRNLTVDAPIASGCTVGFRFNADVHAVARTGIGFFEMHRASTRIHRARLFWDAP